MAENMHMEIETDTLVKNLMVGTFSKIFRVNINTGEYSVYKNDGLLDDDMDDAPDIYTYMQNLITGGLIYPEYVTACRRFTNPEYVRKSIFSGVRRIVQSYRRRTSKGDKWVTFAIIAGPDCAPENPTVLFTWREAESDAITLLDTLPTISSLYDKLIRINLSNNTYEPVIVDADEQERLVGGVINMYEWWAGYSKNGNVAVEDVGAFSTLTKTGSLQKRFAEDPTPVNFRYRRMVNGEYRWTQLQIAPSVEYSEDNQIMLLSLKDIHEEYTAEIRSRQELIDNMHRDALTNLFNRLKYNDDIEEFGKSSGPIFTCLYIDVNGLHELNNVLGHQKGDEMLCCVAEALRKFFPEESVYRIGGDEFVVMSTRLTKPEIELVIDKARKELHKEGYEISVGIESGACGEDVERIVADAEAAMRSDKASYYMRNGDRRQKRQMNEKLEQMLVEKRDNELFLDIITRQFSCVHFVDHNSDTARYIHDPMLFSELAKETDGSFNAALRLYIERFVKPECHELFDDIISYDKLEQRLSKNDIVDITYQKINGDDMIMRIRKVDRGENAGPETVWMVWKRPA